jgi:hypothetical protein
MATKIGVSANTGTGPVMGNPALRPDGSVQGVAPSTATSTVAALEAQQEKDRAAYAAYDARLPRHVMPRDQARATGAEAPERYGNVGEANTAEVPLPKVQNAALMNADPARNTNR